MMYYLLSYFPGGTTGIQFVMQMFYGAFWNFVAMVKAMVFR
jgi:hypothetical protein